ncbi:HEXXH motif domain-containing protein [Amycolatopsis sp. NPDC026612]|uniref:HEXXH motif domain-containing protein n=1 Tax=Amycolatopsis sp. NPDC026612 TaxID=3155466 RepID=UPI0033E242DE
MNPQVHRLSRADLVTLSRGGGGAAVVRNLVAARRSRTLLLIRYIIGATSGDERVRRAFEALRNTHRRAPEAVARVLDDPFVGAWATRTATELKGGRPAAPERLANVALAAAVLGRVDAVVTVSGAGRLILPSMGIVQRQVSGDVGVRHTPEGTDVAEGVRIPLRWQDTVPAWHPFPRITVGAAGVSTSFSVDIWSPEELPPDLQISDQVDLPGWQDMATRTWDLLTSHHSEVAEGLAAGVSVLSPLRPVPSGMTSATLDDTFGCVFLSAAPNPLALALTLAHELHHTKLVALMDLIPLVEPLPGERFYAPWREDPRPAVGLLHGTYAFTGVAAFWRRQRHYELTPQARAHADTEFARWRLAAAQAAGTLLRSGRLTDLGVDFVTGMAALLDDWCREEVPLAARRRAAQLADEHWSRWVAGHR